MPWISSFRAMQMTLALFLRTFLGNNFQRNWLRVIELTTKTNLDFSRKIETVGTTNNNGAAILITVDRKKFFKENIFHANLIHI